MRNKIKAIGFLAALSLSASLVISGVAFAYEPEAVDAEIEQTSDTVVSEPILVQPLK